MVKAFDKREEKTKMTEEHHRIYFENEKLIYWFKKKYDLNGMDWTEIIQESLMKAIVNYDHERAKLSTYFNKVAKNDMVAEFIRRDNSFQYALGERDCISSTVSREVELTKKSKEILDECTEREKEILHLIMEGYTQTDIANKLNVSRNVITYILKKIREKNKGG